MRPFDLFSPQPLQPLLPRGSAPQKIGRPSPPLPAGRRRWRTSVRLATAVAALVAGLAPAAGAASGGNLHIKSFSHAKRELMRIYATHPTTLYSGCVWRPADLRIDYQACLYQPRYPRGRGGRIEWEHVVPASAFGHHSKAWREGHPRCSARGGRRFRGRACAGRVDVNFRRMEADMHNLVPEIGEINALRGNVAMGETSGRYLQPGGLSLRLGEGIAGVAISGVQAFEPPDAVKGDVARIYLYMDAAYSELRLLTSAQRQVFVRWSADDPPDTWECERQARIAQVQGNINSFVLAGCPVAYP